MFGPKDTVTEGEVKTGLTMLLWDGVNAQIMGVLTGGAFLVAFALLLGASNVIIGLLAAVGPFAQILQIPSIFLIEKVRMRKMWTITSAFFGRIFWIPIALLPWMPEGARMPVFILAIFVYFGMGALTGCAWNSWMRDLIPEKILGSYFAKRMALATALGAILSMAAGIGVDVWKARYSEVYAYVILFLFGTGAGMVSLGFLARIPEPRMPVSSEGKGVFRMLAQPFKDKNFRQLLIFLGTWSFSVNLAAAFFVVYMIARLKLTMTWVLGLSVLSQFVNVVFYPIWGRLADRFTNKSVLAASGPIFTFCTVLWVFTMMPEKYFLTIPLLIFIHALTGVSTAGINLAAGNIALKAAPKGKATVYLATNALVCGVAATIAPIMGGFAADWFSDQRIDLMLTWTHGASGSFQLPVFSLKGLDFLFIGSFVVGFFALRQLIFVKEEGEVEEKVVMTHFYAQVRQAIRSISNVAGLRHLTSFPFAILKGTSRKQKSAHVSNGTKQEQES
jgi:MFS family permease